MLGKQDRTLFCRLLGLSKNRAFQHLSEEKQYAKALPSLFALAAMPPVYHAFTPDAEIKGEILRALLTTAYFQARGPQVLTQHGLPADPTPGA